MKTIFTILILFTFIVTTNSQAQLTFQTRINFGKVTCGEKICLPLVIKNTTADQLRITGVSGLSGTSKFPLDQATPINTPTNLATNDSVRWLFCYQGNIISSLDSSRIVITYTDKNNVSLDTSVTFIAESMPIGDLNLSINSINFGSVPVFTSDCRTVTISNTGSTVINMNPIVIGNANFNVKTPPPLTILPGTNANIEICFNPSNDASESSNAIVSYSICGRNLTKNIALNGIGIFPPKVNLGPVLEINTNPFDFGSVLCGTTDCRTNLTLRNIGSDPMNISRIDNLILPFRLNATVNTPIILQPNQSQTLPVCYSPIISPKVDSQIVNMIVDNRTSLSISMIMDVSGSMEIVTSTGEKRITAANAGGKYFLNNLVIDPARSIVDEAEIIKFSSDIQVVQNFSSDINLLKSKVPTVSGGSTRIYDAVNVGLDNLLTRRIPGRRVIVLLTDGEDNSGYSQTAINSIIARANLLGVRIYTIGFGVTSTIGRNTLHDLSINTGGTEYYPLNATELLDVYKRIALDLSKNIPFTFVLKGRSIAPLMVLTPSVINFDSVKINKEKCGTVVISNTGDAPLVLASAPIELKGFRITSSFPITIAPGSSSQVNVCFSPRKLRVLDSSFTFNYNDCKPPINLMLKGVGYDSVVISLRDTIVAKPGGLFEIPIYIQDSLPASYDVNTLDLTLKGNKTMMFPSNDVTASGGSLSSLPTVNVNNIYSVTDSLGFYKYTFSNGTLNNVTKNSILTYLRFRALLGNSIKTPLLISSAKFADGNPKVGIINTGLLRLDSLCYLEQKLIDASSRYNAGLMLKAGSNSSLVYIDYFIKEPQEVKVSLFNSIGVLISKNNDEFKNVGVNNSYFDITNLNSGIYYVTVCAGNLVETQSVIITK